MPANVISGYMAGREFADSEKARGYSNQLRAQDVALGQEFQNLAHNAQATPDQYARIGRSDVSNALVNNERQGEQRKQQLAGRLMLASQYALQSDNPKAFVEQNFPELVEHAGAQWASATNEQIRASLQGVAAKFGAQAGVGPTQPAPVGALEKVIGPDGKPVFATREQAVGQPAFYQEPTPAGGGGSQLMTADEVAAAGLPVGTVAQRTTNGRISIISKPDAGPGSKPPTEGDKRARVMYRSMQNAEKQLAAVTESDTSDLGQAILGKISAGKVLQSQEYKRYEAAGLRWAANLLYLKSGATATPDEIRSTYLQFLPQPGDGQGVKDQKNEARGQELAAINEAYSFEAPRSGAVPPPAAPAAAPVQPAAPVQVKSDQEYAALKSGTQYVAPDGSVRTKR